MFPAGLLLGLFPLLALHPGVPAWSGLVAVRYVLPYGLLLLAFALGGCFRQSRVAFISLLFTSTLGVLQLAMFQQDDPGRARAIVALATIYVPTFSLILYHVRERGLFTAYGAIRFALVCSAVLVLMLLPVLLRAVGTPSGGRVFLGFLSSAVQLPLLGLLILAVCIPLFCLRVPQESPVLGPMLALACVHVFAALNYGSSLWADGRDVAVLSLFLSGAALTLITAVLESVWQSAHIDELTELPGRRALRYHLARLSGSYILAVADIDHFKKVNDTYGHATGDQVLRFIASFLRQFPLGTAYRQGGEEFLLVCEKASFADVVDALDALRESIAARPFAIRGLNRPRGELEEAAKLRAKGAAESITVTISIGVAMQAPEHATPQDVLTAADKALYLAKKNGRNRVRTAR